MPYTTEEGGRLNNFAVEPKVYEAEPPSSSQQRNYIIMGVGALLLIGGLLTVAVYASSNAGVS
ncbi:MAG: ssl1498 family light-harvesting-like protein [Crocosphaera sp.]|nr:ssl1498 family light-harvesting-like protein [Crocosphaera sp.]